MDYQLLQHETLEELLESLDLEQEDALLNQASPPGFLQRSTNGSRDRPLTDLERSEAEVLGAVGTRLLYEFRQQGGRVDALKGAIHLLRRALDRHTAEDDYRSQLLSNFAHALLWYFQLTERIHALPEAIAAFREALRLCPPGIHPHRGKLLYNCANAFLTQHEYDSRSGDRSSLAEAACLLREMLEECPRGHGHPERIMAIGKLANVLMIDHGLSGNGDALEEAVYLFREVLDACPHGHPGRGTALDNLASALLAQYQHFGNNNSVLEEAILLFREVLQLSSPDNPSRNMLLNDLATALLAQYKYSGSSDALNEAAYLLGKALVLCPHANSDRAHLLNNLGNTLMIRYMQSLGSASSTTLEEIIQLRREAFDLFPHDHPYYSGSLNNLANTLIVHYEQFGNMSALEEATRLLRKALELRPRGHATRADSLNNLANALIVRYKLTGSTDTLEEVVGLRREPLELCPDDHSDRGTLMNNLANALLSQHKHLGSNNASRLEEAISLFRKALELFPHGHPNRGNALNNLANAVLARHQHLGSSDALDEAAWLFQEALKFYPHNSLDRVDLLNDLAFCYWSRFLHDGDEIHLKSALKFWKETLNARPVGHPDRYFPHHAIARVYLEDTSLFNWSEAINHIRKATDDNSALPRQRLKESIISLQELERALVRNLDEYPYSELALDTYIAVIQLLPRVAHFGLDLPTRLRELSGSEQLCRTAALRAMLLEQPHIAIELYEGGKTVFWSQALRLRSTEIDALPVSDRDELLRLFQLLERDSVGFSGDTTDTARVESWISYRHHLSEQAENLIGNIRLRPGWDRFLRTPQFDKLVKAADRGFVVVLVANNPWFFALIIHPDGTLQPILFNSISRDMLVNLCDQISTSGLRDFYPRCSETERGLRIKQASPQAPLEKMWRAIVEPIIQGLGLKKATGRQRPRIHWYPSGDVARLPLHAAGIYEGKDQVCTADFVVSSYTPSLSALIKSREGFKSLPRDEMQCLISGESAADTSGMAPIPEVVEEINTVARVMLSASATVVNDVIVPPKVNVVLEQMPVTNILHLACHGVQNADPLKSCFILNDGRLTISALMKLNLPDAMLAFLSACETAKGDKDQPDQVVHLAASMLFCGFRSVIATMWSMYDMDGPKMAQWFYETLLENEKIELDDIPYALDAAVKRLRDSGASPARWATYVHFGA